MNSDQVTSLARNILQFFGGILVSKGILTQPDLMTAVGAIVALGSLAWSMFVHKQS